MRLALWFRTSTRLDAGPADALQRWLNDNHISVEALALGPIVISTDLRVIETQEGDPVGARLTNLETEIPGDLWAALVDADALWCGNLEHLDVDGKECGIPLDVAGEHRDPAPGGPLDGAGITDGWELSVPFVIADVHGGPYDTDTLEAGYWLGRIDMALEQAAVCGAADLSFPLVPAGIITQLELQGMYRGFPIVLHDLLDTSTADPRWAAVTFTRASELPT